jgi:hypothetical protein
MKSLNHRLQRAGDLLLNLFAPKAEAAAQGWKCTNTGISCGWPKVYYHDYVKDTSCGCW